MAFCKTAIAALTIAGLALADVEYAGVNESGGEFGGNVLPGEFGVNYEFINPATVDVYAQQNQVNLFRVSFLMERMCPPATGLGSTFNETVYSPNAEVVAGVTNGYSIILYSRMPSTISPLTMVCTASIHA